MVLSLIQCIQPSVPLAGAAVSFRWPSPPSSRSSLLPLSLFWMACCAASPPTGRGNALAEGDTPRSVQTSPELMFHTPHTHTHTHSVTKQTDTQPTKRDRLTLRRMFSRDLRGAGRKAMALKKPRHVVVYTTPVCYPLSQSPLCGTCQTLASS